MSRSTSSLREQWAESTNREAVLVLPLLALVFIGVLYGAYFVPGFWSGLSWWGILGAGAALALGFLVGLARSVGYRPISASPTESLWHITSAPALLEATPGSVVTLDVDRCRPLARMPDRSRPWRLPRRGVYFFTSAPSVAAAEANVSSRRRRAAVLLELDPAGLGAPMFQRGSAVASTTGYRGQVRSVTPLHASIADDQ